MLNVDRVARTINGRAVPYDVVGHQKLELPGRYPFGSLVWDEWPLLLVDHNQSLRVGKAYALQPLSWGLWASFKVSNGPKGDRALEMAATTHPGLSIGLDPKTVKFRTTPDGIWECVFGRIIEVSLTANPVFH